MKIITLLAGAFTLVAGAATAEVAALGSTATGGTSEIGRTMAAAVSEASPLQLRPQELANTADYIPLVNSGEIEFGIANVVQYSYAVSGTGMSEGRPNPNMRMAATLMPFRVSYIVRRDSDINSLADLAGKRVPSFSEGALGDFVNKAFLGTAGLTMADVEEVPVPNFPRMWASFAEGSSDVAIVVVGAANSREFDATFGIRYLSFEDTPEALVALNEFLPQAYFAALTADSGIPGVTEPTNINVFDYVFFASAEVSDDMVYTAVKALWEKETDLLAGGPFWGGFEKERMGLANGNEYHPGAIRFYQEMGVWNQ